jgi:hypothetical protein
MLAWPESALFKTMRILELVPCEFDAMRLVGWNAVSGIVHNQKGVWSIFFLYEIRQRFIHLDLNELILPIPQKNWFDFVTVFVHEDLL